jgi:two-component system, NtrC family, response regulator HydG
MPRRKRLLFVDDEPSIRLTLPSVLAAHGFVVTTAESVREAIARIERANFDVLLSDLNIGQELDGFRVVSAMKKRHPHCVNIILTGHPAFESAVLAIRHQVDDYVVKPADIDVLINTIKLKLSQQRVAKQG